MFISKKEYVWRYFIALPSTLALHSLCIFNKANIHNLTFTESSKFLNITLDNIEKIFVPIFSQNADRIATSNSVLKHSYNSSY